MTFSYLKKKTHKNWPKFVTNVFGCPTSSYEVVFSTKNIKYLRRLLQLIMSFSYDLINNIAFSMKFLLIAVGSFLPLVIRFLGWLFVLYQRILPSQIDLLFCNETALYLFFHFSIDLVFETFKQKTQVNMYLGGTPIKK